MRRVHAKICSLAEAIADNVQDGDCVALEGFTHLIPYAAGHEIIRQRRRDLTLIRMTPDVLYDQMIGMGVARALRFSWGGNPGVGSLHRFRDAVENGWPQPLQLDEHSHAGMACAYQAGAANLPFGVLRGYTGVELPKLNSSSIRSVMCPFTGERLSAVRAIRPDVTVIHAQRADRSGNVLIEGIIGVQREAVLAAKRAVVTVEEIVERLGASSPNSVVLPGWTLSAIAVAPRGAHPSYVHGYYKRDNEFHKRWDTHSRDRQRFLDWMREHVLDAH